MNAAAAMRDLIAIVADKDMEFSLKGLLSRPKALGIRSVTADVVVHIERDPGCYRRAHDLLRAFTGRYAHAVVLFDRQGCGVEQKTAGELEHEVEARLQRSGWKSRAVAVVLDPELEVWVWSDSPHVAEVLGWSGERPTLRDWLLAKGFAQQGRAKPRDLKAAMEAVLRRTNCPRSAARYEQLAKRVSFERCVDPVFTKLKKTLRGWFSASPEGLASDSGTSNETELP